MGFDLIAYDSLETGIKDSVDILLKTYKCKDVSELSNPERVSQTGFLLELVKLLSSNKEKSEKINDFKSHIYTSAIYYVWDQILHSSGGPNSVLFKELDKRLKFSTNKLTDDEKYVLYEALVSFLCSQLYVDSNPFKGYLINKPTSYGFEKAIIDLNTKLSNLFTDKVKTQTIPPLVKKEGGFFSAWGWGFSTQTNTDTPTSPKV